MSSAIPEVTHGAVRDRSSPAPAHPTPPPWANTPAYRAYAVLAALLGASSLALTVRFPGQVLPTSTAYVTGCVIVLVVVTTLILRGVRVPGTLVGDLPEALLTTPLLAVAPHWGYVVATVAVTLWTCLRWRLTRLDTTFNVGIAGVSSGAATGVYHLAGGATAQDMTWHVVLAALAGDPHQLGHAGRAAAHGHRARVVLGRARRPGHLAGGAARPRAARHRARAPVRPGSLGQPALDRRAALHRQRAAPQPDRGRHRPPRPRRRARDPVADARLGGHRPAQPRPGGLPHRSGPLHRPRAGPRRPARPHPAGLRRPRGHGRRGHALARVRARAEVARHA